jgi:hypothetical protein
VGDPVTFATRSWENDTSFFGKALDDRVGLFVMLAAVRKAQKRACDLYLVASTQEEYALRGAGPALPLLVWSHACKIGVGKFCIHIVVVNNLATWLAVFPFKILHVQFFHQRVDLGKILWPKGHRMVKP